MPGSEMAGGLAFADTNVWLYAFLAAQDARKSALAQIIIKDTPLAPSTQVINEVCVNLIKKAGFSETQIRELIDAFHERHRVVSIDRPILHRASELRERYSFSFWDSMILASALAADERVFLF